MTRPLPTTPAPCKPLPRPPSRLAPAPASRRASPLASPTLPRSRAPEVAAPSTLVPHGAPDAVPHRPRPGPTRHTLVHREARNVAHGRAGGCAEADRPLFIAVPRRSQDMARLSLEARVSAVEHLRRTWFGEAPTQSRLDRILVATNLEARSLRAGRGAQ
jgi:hypothetical protein